jgi:hypothetical protein
MTKTEMIEKIIRNMKANSLYVSGDLFLALAFRTESELRTICAELHINERY